MITTDKVHELPLFAVEPGVTTWRAATLTPPMLYVFVNYGIKEEKFWVYQTTILWDPRDVISFGFVEQIE